MPKLCTIDGCNKTYRARGLCATHYNGEHRKPNPVAEFQCPSCGVTFSTERARAKRYTRLYCTQACRDTMRKHEAKLRHSQVVKWQPRPVLHLAIERMPPPLKQRRARTITAGYCAVCRSPFAAMHNNTVTCSTECQVSNERARVRDAQHRRRALKRNAFVSPVYRHDIYRRDQWTCQLCAMPLDMRAEVPHPQAPTLDHIIALANGGTHEPSNVQAAHFLCNALKSDHDWSYPPMSPAMRPGYKGPRICAVDRR